MLDGSLAAQLLQSRVGNILLFDNLGAGGRSRVVEFDPSL